MAAFASSPAESWPVASASSAAFSNTSAARSNAPYALSTLASSRKVAALAPVYDAWSFKVLPRLGQAVAKDGDSYQYLAESIRMFPDQDSLAAMMRNAGLSRVSVRNLSGGIAAIHQGWRL